LPYEEREEKNFNDPFLAGGNRKKKVKGLAGSIEQKRKQTDEPKSSPECESKTTQHNNEGRKELV